jgi:hypothetical protein
MKPTTILLTLNNDLLATRNTRATAMMSHNLTLSNGIDTLKQLFDSVSEIKKLDEKSLVKVIQYKVATAEGIEDFKLNNDTKRILKISHKLISGYKVKKELLSIAQIEQLITFNKETVNSIMNIQDDESYLDAVKEIIKTAKINTSTQVFSVKLARTL